MFGNKAPPEPVCPGVWPLLGVIDRPEARAFTTLYGLDVGVCR